MSEASISEAMQEARRRLRRSYLEGLTSKIEALDSLRAELEAGRGDAPERVRRLAHQLSGSGGSYGFPDISTAAQRVEVAADGELGRQLEALVGQLRHTLAESAELPTARILIVDDDRDLRTLLLHELSSEHRVVDSAATAAEALEMLERTTYDLVLVDLILPDGDGRNLVTAIRDRPATADVAMFVMSALDDPRTHTECLALGAEHCFAKPVQAHTVSAAVAQRLAQLRREEEHTLVDALTGLLNRAGLQRTYQRELAGAQRRADSLALAFFDVDDFKRLNDRAGHITGDRALQRIAGALTARLRKGDTAARWGGDEFLVLMPGTKPSDAARVLAAVQDSLATTHDGVPAVGLSGGVIGAAPGVGLDECVDRADALLQQAKAQGGRRFLTAAQTVVLQVLHVEDDPDMQARVGGLLAAHGLAVVRAGSGREALERLGAQSFQLVILDRVLGDEDGFGVLETIRARSAKPPVLMLTSIGADDEVARAFALGADDYVQKPFGSRELLARVRRLLWAHAAGR
jgi:diguanylate cyclase (GGDEF)-like protein